MMKTLSSLQYFLSLQNLFKRDVYFNDLVLFEIGQK